MKEYNIVNLTLKKYVIYYVHSFKIIAEKNN